MAQKFFGNVPGEAYIWLLTDKGGLTHEYRNTDHTNA
jgi:hypothetical protein